MSPCVFSQLRAGSSTSDCYFVYGLTATPIRKDGHQPIIFMQCGKIRFTSDAKSQMENQGFKRLLIPRFTSFRSIISDRKTYVQITQELSEDKVRNEFVMEDVKAAIQKDEHL